MNTPTTTPAPDPMQRFEELMHDFCTSRDSFMMAPVEDRFHIMDAAGGALRAYVAKLAEDSARLKTKRDKEVWRVAMTLANNLCTQHSDRLNADDMVEEAHVATDCAKSIRGWIAPTNEQLAEMFSEAGFDAAREEAKS